MALQELISKKVQKIQEEEGVKQRKAKEAKSERERGYISGCFELAQIAIVAGVDAETIYRPPISWNSGRVSSSIYFSVCGLEFSFYIEGNEGHVTMKRGDGDKGCTNMSARTIFTVHKEGVAHTLIEVISNLVSEHMSNVLNKLKNLPDKREQLLEVFRGEREDDDQLYAYLDEFIALADDGLIAEALIKSNEIGVGMVDKGKSGRWLIQSDGITYFCKRYAKIRKHYVPQWVLDELEERRDRGYD